MEIERWEEHRTPEQSVLLGIEPGYFVFPSHKKQCICLVRRTAICMKHEKISSNAPGLGLMTHRETS
jgi:hypothetical protein